MPRPPEFDQEKAVDEALLLFWAQGYSTTSVRDLLGVMGIKESSFYNAWPSKRHLYLRCLERYIQEYMSPWIAAMMACDNPREGLKIFFDKMFETQADPNLPSSCLMSRSLSTEVMDDPVLRTYIEEKWQGFGALLTRFLQQGKDAGYYPETFQPGQTASLIGIYIQGLQKVVLVQADLPALRRSADAFLDALGV